MTTAVDTNVFVGLWNPADSLNARAATALESLKGRVVVCGAVYAELLAFPGRTESFLEKFFHDELIDVDWSIGERIWRSAGHAFSKYAARRRKERSGYPRRILTDFIIGAHALESRYQLLTLDEGLYSAAFPKLKLVRI